jgi:hypothetical protein
MLIGRRQDQGELLTAIAGRHIARSPGCLCQDAGELTKNIVTRLVPSRVIERFGVVEIEQQQ